MRQTRTVAVIGGGVIGGGWAARFLLSGWDVNLFDPVSSARDSVHATLARARRSYPALYDAMLPAEGSLRFPTELRSAVADAEWIQESVPERLSFKQDVYGEIQEHSPPGAIIASSTSGFKPSELQQGATRPDELIVAHPFNPVYLLPVVELVRSDSNPPGILDRADGILRQIGMRPLVVRAEIEAHIGDRLLEAVWREALWLLHDDIATTGEIDDVITHGFGLRWAQMGLFETYRIAGGAAGMAHFLEQFGPCLAFPWTRLMDTPPMTGAFAEEIGKQSNEQSGHHTIDELERIRDANLVTMLRGLKARNWGPGRFLRDSQQSLTAPLPENRPEKPMITIKRVIPPDWIDYNGHLNEARYLEVFSLATDEFLARIGCDQSYVAAGMSYFTLETHIRHLNEAYEGDAVEVKTVCLFGQGKKLHLHHVLCNEDGAELATGEHLLLHIDLNERRSCEPGGKLACALEEISAAHSRALLPDWAQPKLGFKNT